MTSGTLSDDLAWWRDHRDAPDIDPAVLRDLLARLQAWKAQHDRDRAGHPPPFLRMAWDGVFADEDQRVTETIRDLEAALAAA